jgi:hypothetical protein
MRDFIIFRKICNTAHALKHNLVLFRAIRDVLVPHMYWYHTYWYHPKCYGFSVRDVQISGGQQFAIRSPDRLLTRRANAEALPRKTSLLITWLLIASVPDISHRCRMFQYVGLHSVTTVLHDFRCAHLTLVMSIDSATLHFMVIPSPPPFTCERVIADHMPAT